MMKPERWQQIETLYHAALERAVIQEIQIKLTPQEQVRLASARPVNPAAYDEYLRGRFFANRQNKADNETTIKALEHAVALDPTFAAAYAELAHFFQQGAQQLGVLLTAG